jgi:hypothetical protein
MMALRSSSNRPDRCHLGRSTLASGSGFGRVRGRFPTTSGGRPRPPSCRASTCCELYVRARRVELELSGAPQPASGCHCAGTMTADARAGGCAAAGQPRGLEISTESGHRRRRPGQRWRLRPACVTGSGDGLWVATAGRRFSSPCPLRRRHACLCGRKWPVHNPPAGQQRSGRRRIGRGGAAKRHLPAASRLRRRANRLPVDAAGRTVAPDDRRMTGKPASRTRLGTVAPGDHVRNKRFAFNALVHPGLFPNPHDRPVGHGDRGARRCCVTAKAGPRGNRGAGTGGVRQPTGGTGGFPRRACRRTSARRPDRLSPPGAFQRWLRVRRVLGPGHPHPAAAGAGDGAVAKALSRVAQATVLEPSGLRIGQPRYFSALGFELLRLHRCSTRRWLGRGHDAARHPRSRRSRVMKRRRVPLHFAKSGRRPGPRCSRRLREGGVGCLLR